MVGVQMMDPFQAASDLPRLDHTPYEQRGWFSTMMNTTFVRMLPLPQATWWESGHRSRQMIYKTQKLLATESNFEDNFPKWRRSVNHNSLAILGTSMVMDMGAASCQSVAGPDQEPRKHFAGCSLLPKSTPIDGRCW